LTSCGLIDGFSGLWLSVGSCPDMMGCEVGLEL
jgi:hypothetical protein